MTTKYFTFQKILGVANNGIEYNSQDTIKNYLIPDLSETFQKEIENLVLTAHEKIEQSKIFYKKAEEILLEELNLKDFAPKNEASISNRLVKVLEIRGVWMRNIIRENMRRFWRG